MVAEVTEEQVTLDANHPLSGISLRLHLKVVAVRAATEEELERGSVGSGASLAATGMLAPAAEHEPITECEVNRLEDYQAAVGGWVEPVDIPALSVTVYVNEEAAVAAGATHLRIGSAITGPRPLRG